MPIYEYEPVDHDCLMCDGRVAVIQGVSEEPLTYCPDCGMEVKRVISKASFQFSKGNYDAAARKGLTTFRKAETGVWEKIAGPGVDGIISTPEDRAAVEAEKAPRKIVDLDESS